MAASLAFLPASASAYAPVTQPGPPYTASPAALAASVHCTPNIRTAGREPVVLLPATGVNSDQNFRWNWEPALDALGIPWCTSDQPGDANSNLTDIQKRGDYVVYAIRRASALSGRRVAVMGHSQGGMVMRWALRWWPDTRGLVADVIGMAGSNHGTTQSGNCSNGCSPAGLQQAFDSSFIAALNSRQETFAGVDYTEIYTRHDEVVTPNGDSHGSSSVHGPGRVTNVATQDVCPADPSEHLIVGTADPVAYALAVDAMTHDGPADPGRIDPSVCTQAWMPGVDPASVGVDASTAAAALASNTALAPSVPTEPPLDCYVTGTCIGPKPALRLTVGRNAVTVRDARGGWPLPGARVRIRAAAATTDLAGRAALRLRGARRLTAHVAGYPTAVVRLRAR